MKELIFEDGDLQFRTDDTIEGFENKIVNSLLIFGVETFWNGQVGLNFDVISSNQTEYKLEHIKAKLLEWYKDEIDTLRYKEIKIVDKVVKATLEYKHKTFGEIKQEVSI